MSVGVGAGVSVGVGAGVSVGVGAGVSVGVRVPDGAGVSLAVGEGMSLVLADAVGAGDADGSPDVPSATNGDAIPETKTMIVKTVRTIELARRRASAGGVGTATSR